MSKRAAINYSQSAFALWFFSSGCCTVIGYAHPNCVLSHMQRCSKWTDSQPIQVLFRFRACSDAFHFAATCAFFVDTTSTGKHEKSLFGGWLPRLEEAGNTDGEWTHTYTTCDLRDAQCELNQAVTVAAGNACRAPNSFAIQTVKELKAGTLISFIVVTYFTNMFTPHEYILRTRSRAPLSRELKIWKAEYDAQRARIRHDNLAFIKKCVLGEDVKLKVVIRTPTTDY
ncbi:hypothetical protein C8J57DRAFT_1220480 [Mycena rebaudengoi]|nr:hypothetical protein C8J57DRAFT_1220480 [Mycena rebaudengoi]